VVTRGSTGSALDRSELSDEVRLRLFCDRVAWNCRVYDADGYPGNFTTLRPFLAVRSDTYFFRVAHRVGELVDDAGIAASNRENYYRWTRLLGMRVVGSRSSAIIPRLIEVLQLERLTIEHAFWRGAFRFDERPASTRPQASPGSCN
jgi:hypothetical protein